MFLPENVQIEYNPNFTWDPLKFSSPKFYSDDILYPLGKFCPRYIEQSYKNYKLVLTENKELFSNLFQHTGILIDHAYDIISLSSALDTQVSDISLF